MTVSAFDIARKIKYLPGVQVSATIDPTTISKKVKNAAQKMLRAGVLMGGYRSTSRMLAEQILQRCGCSEVAVIQPWGVYLRTNVSLDKATKRQMLDLVDAAYVIELSDTAAERNPVYVTERYETIRKGLKDHKYGQINGTVCLSLYQRDLHKQIAEIASAQRNPHQIRAHEEAAAMLDSTEPFAFNLFA